MTEHPILMGVVLLIWGVLGATFNKPLARLSGKIGRATGAAFSGEEYFQFRRVMNIIGGVLMAIGGLLLMLGMARLK